MTQFNFEFQTIKAEDKPKRTGGTGGQSKYDWSLFPAPDDKGNLSCATIEVSSPKSLYTSVAKYKAKLKKDGVEEADMPVFEMSRNKDPETGKIVSVTVYRTK